MDRGPGPLLFGNQRSGHLRSGRCSSSLRQRCDLWRWRRRHGRETGPSVFGPALVMNPPNLQEVRSMPLFAKLTDEQLGSLDEGEVIEAPVGTVLGPE